MKIFSAARRAPGRRPKEAEFLGNPAFHRLFLTPRQLKPRLVVKGSGIDWLAVSAEWEAEGLKLSKADLERLAAATGRFVKLPNSGWVELDTAAVQGAHEAMADMGVDGLIAVPQKVGMEHVAHLDEDGVSRALPIRRKPRRCAKRVRDFKGVPSVDCQTCRPICVRIKRTASIFSRTSPNQARRHSGRRHGPGQNAADADLAGVAQGTQHEKSQAVARHLPGVRAAQLAARSERFTPDLKVLVLESGAARHNLRKQIPQHDMIVTNYALLRRDLEELQKFAFRAVILDEAQFIKNPGAQVTQSVKQLKCEHRSRSPARRWKTGCSICGASWISSSPATSATRNNFWRTYEPRGENAESAQRIARRRLSAKLRPLLLRRLKKHVAKDLPDRIEERRDCPLGDEQRKLYLAELRRSRDQVMKAVETQGLNKSKMHVLAALTRLRQICCHPSLVGSDTAVRQDRHAVRIARPAGGRRPEGPGLQPVCADAATARKGMSARQHHTHILTGQTKDRQQVVSAFQKRQPSPAFSC
jgi:hypothetical protein